MKRHGKKKQFVSYSCRDDAIDMHDNKWHSQYGLMWSSAERQTERFGTIPEGRVLRHEHDIRWK